MTTLELASALTRPDLLAIPIRTALENWTAPTPVDQVEVAEIDPALANTAAFCERYDVRLEESANCVIVAAKRGTTITFAACMILATTRADVNTLVRKHLDARKASFAPMNEAVGLTGMEYGGITPIGLPPGWPILVDRAVAESRTVVIGSGLRRSKLWLPGTTLTELPEAEVLDGLGVTVA